jgi:hypothetical protein
MMGVWLHRADGVVRAQLAAALEPNPGGVIWRLAGLACACGLVYGTVMGSFGGMTGDRAWQVLYSAAKVPLLLLGTFALCLPSFFVLNTLAGLRNDFAAALRALLAAQAGMTLVLCSLAPLTIVWYLTSANYHAAVLFNGLVFGIASLATQSTLRRLYRPLIERHRAHVLLLRLWLALYTFVGIQLGWVLRPFIGLPGSEAEWFRDNAWGNAYVEVLHHLAGLVLR